MRALIMIAGRGTRISRYLNGNPKCTVSIGNTSLIENTIKQLHSKGIYNISLVTGYEHSYIENLLKDYDVKFYYNPFFDVTNSIASAWFARDFILEDDNLIIMNGDVFLEDSLWEDIINENLSPVLFCDTTRKEEADYKFYFENNILMKYGKELKGADISGEYIGVAKIGTDFIKIFKENLTKMIENQNHNVWWENILYDLINTEKIYVKETSHKFWAEVDYIEDYERILRFRNYKLCYNITIVENN